MKWIRAHTRIWSPLWRERDRPTKERRDENLPGVPLAHRNCVSYKLTNFLRETSGGSVYKIEDSDKSLVFLRTISSALLFIPMRNMNVSYYTTVAKEIGDTVKATPYPVLCCKIPVRSSSCQRILQHCINFCLRRVNQYHWRMPQKNVPNYQSIQEVRNVPLFTHAGFNRLSMLAPVRGEAGKACFINYLCRSPH